MVKGDGFGIRWLIVWPTVLDSTTCDLIRGMKEKAKWERGSFFFFFFFFFFRSILMWHKGKNNFEYFANILYFKKK
jgi:hypothetical protein